MKTVKIILTILGFVLFFFSVFVLFEPSDNPTGFFVYTPSIAIINPSNNQPLNSNLEIEFMTKGTNDLTITAKTGEMKVIGLKCNDEVMGNTLEYQDYKCGENSILLVKVLSKDLELEFKFGNNIQQATNTCPSTSSCGCGK